MIHLENNFFLQYMSFRQDHTSRYGSNHNKEHLPWWHWVGYFPPWRKISTKKYPVYPNSGTETIIYISTRTLCAAKKYNEAWTIWMASLYYYFASTYSWSLPVSQQYMSDRDVITSMIYFIEFISKVIYVPNLQGVFFFCSQSIIISLKRIFSVKLTVVEIVLGRLVS